LAKNKPKKEKITQLENTIILAKKQTKETNLFDWKVD